MQCNKQLATYILNHACLILLNKPDSPVVLAHRIQLLLLCGLNNCVIAYKVCSKKAVDLGVLLQLGKAFGDGFGELGCYS